MCTYILDTKLSGIYTSNPFLRYKSWFYSDFLLQTTYTGKHYKKGSSNNLLPEESYFSLTFKPAHITVSFPSFFDKALSWHISLARSTDLANSPGIQDAYVLGWWMDVKIYHLPLPWLSVILVMSQIRTTPFSFTFPLPISWDIVCF